MLNAVGEPEKFAGVCDITDRKRAEGIQLLLQRACGPRRAERANRTKDEFRHPLPRVAHPLNAIVGWASMLRTGKLDGDILSMRSRLSTAMPECGSIDQDISTFPGLPAAKCIGLRGRSNRSSHLCSDGLIRLAAQSKNIQLQLLIDPSMIGLGNPDRLQQIVWNLSRTRLVHPSGRQRETIRGVTTRRFRSGKDSGQGISGDFLPYVFERFRQADGSLTRTHKGLGLGLAIVRHLVELTAARSK